ncbi:fatty acid amide hydrolase 2 [Defluviimonas denitrificans]|jgi:fatty acid amide hydrolase 2|uniref:Fatty acid amide hydrolase 2 n=1 Tax=Albidovulum denitrificans TaxID=404881 RepID=A0A2S8RYY1_9RHOB|nr:amidase [Defluviimonas denitrificans]PQV53757.1 fatty acid amide hydrolase 2 [Defluviimonas denitrificans]
MIAPTRQHGAPVAGPPATARIAPQSALIAAGRATSEALTREALDRLAVAGPRLRALSHSNADTALTDARRADAIARRLGQAALDDMPLLGLPMTVKEGLKCAGAPWTMGSSVFRGRIATEDGTAVARLRAAGAVIVGQGSMAEMALWTETTNRLTGRACHPLDPSRSPGGSSGGDAALVAAGAVSAALGADGGGSVRIPAAWCGLYAHKPSMGLVPLTGHFPMDRGPKAEGAALARYFAPGPMCRAAGDLWPILKAIMGPDGVQPGIESPLAGPTPDPALIDGTDIWVLSAPTLRLGSAVEAAQRWAVSRAAEILQRRGARLRMAPVRLLERGFELWMARLMTAEERPVDLSRLLGGGTRVPLLREAGRQILGRGRHSFPAFVLAALSRADPRPAGHWHKLAHAADRLEAEVTDMLGPGGLLLCPPVTGPAPRHGKTLMRPFDIALSAIFNALGLPATVAPVAPGQDGLPRAVQIVAPRRADHLSISAALCLAQDA